MEADDLLQGEKTVEIPIYILEAFLKSHEKEKSIAKIIETRRVTEKVGAHYISNTWRQHSKIIRKDGKEEDVYVIIKMIPKNEFSKNYILRYGLFGKELKVYCEVLPAMEKLMRDKLDYNEFLWPQCIGHRCYDLLVLEDLTCRGYKKLDEKKGLDLKHSILAFRTLAKFHAISVILKEQQLLETYHFKIYYMENNESRSKSMEGKLKRYAQIIRDFGDQTWLNVADQLEKVSDGILAKLIEITRINENDLNVLNHGDTWTSNLLFKYNEFSNDVASMRFVDFQMVHYGSYALDIQYLFNTSVQKYLKLKHYNTLMSAYYDTLVNTFTKYDFIPHNLPTFEEFNCEVKNKNLFGLALSLFLLELMDFEDDSITTIESVVGDKNKPRSTQILADKVFKIVEFYKDVNLTDYTKCVGQNNRSRER